MNEKDRLILEELYVEMTKEQRRELIKQMASGRNEPSPVEHDPRFIKSDPVAHRNVTTNLQKSVKKATQPLFNAEGAIREYLMDKGFKGEQLEQKIAEKMKDMMRGYRGRRKKEDL